MRRVVPRPRDRPRRTSTRASRSRRRYSSATRGSAACRRRSARGNASRAAASASTLSSLSATIRNSGTPPTSEVSFQTSPSSTCRRRRRCLTPLTTGLPTQPPSAPSTPSSTPPLRAGPRRESTRTRHLGPEATRCSSPGRPPRAPQESRLLRFASSHTSGEFVQVQLVTRSSSTCSS